MTAWADYSYYISEYLAGRAPTVSEEDFCSYAVSATAIARLYTGEHIADDNVPDEAKHAVCAIAEAVAANDSARLHDGVAAEKTGDLSVTYESASAREAAFSQTVAGIVRQWLTPWMYLGVRSC